MDVQVFLGNDSRYIWKFVNVMTVLVGILHRLNPHMWGRILMESQDNNG